MAKRKTYGICYGQGADMIADRQRYEILCGTDDLGGTYVAGPLVRGHAETEAGALALAIELAGRAPRVRDTFTGQVAMLDRTGADPDDPGAAAYALDWSAA